MSKRAVLVSALVAIPLALAGCGASVAAGGQNAATHPASGTWVATTVGSENISESSPAPTVAYTAPASTPPKVLPGGLESTRAAVESAVSGGCWENSGQGNLYGAFDQLFWWQGQCNDTVAQVDVELYPTATEAASSSDHASPDALLGRYREGAVLVDVYANAPEAVLSQLGKLSGLAPVPGYQS
ncbi:MAG TPA: hypothetical protein VL984_05725 [Acidimicrobiales bacterium]|nr:hypothetical protein [Acidimicrobiales bacterium]